MTSKDSILYPCDINKYLSINCCCEDSSGTCLIVPVYLHNICKNNHILVIVEVYKDKYLYARQVKEVFTGHGMCDGIIRRMYVGDFEFYFKDICEPSCISVDVKTQYICKQ